MDKKIIRSASKGDMKAFKLIYDTYLPKLRYVCRRYCQREADVDDVLQEAFIKVYQNLKKYKFQGSFEGWVRRILVYTAIDYYKKNKAIYYEELELLADDKPEEEVAHEFLQLKSEEEIIEAIQELPAGYRQVFCLYVLEDYSHKEIGELLNISEGTSRSQLFKAKKMIKNRLTGQRNTQDGTLNSIK